MKYSSLTAFDVRIDQVILDMVMPDMGGAARCSITCAPSIPTCVLLSCGRRIDGRAPDIMERGCNGFIQKPFNMEDLAKRLRAS